MLLFVYIATSRQSARSNLPARSKISENQCHLCNQRYDFPVTRSPDHRITRFPYLPKSFLISTTCISFGHPFQLCRQHTRMSHFFSSCRCARKCRLSYSNSMCTCCQRPGSISCLASQSGYAICNESTQNPSRCATMPKRNTTPASFTGSHASPCSISGGPITGRPGITRRAKCKEGTL